MKTLEEVMSITNTVTSHTALEDPEAKALYECCLQVPSGGLLVEVGCQLGRSSSLFTQMAMDRCFRTIHVDPYTSQPEMLGQWHDMMCRVGGDFTHCYTHLCMRTEQAKWHLKMLGAEGIDMAYIDGDHEYPGVMTDLEILAPMIKSGGLLTCHDYGRDSLPGVYKALTEYIDDKWEAVGAFGTLGVWRRN